MEAMQLLRTRYSASKLGEPPPSVQALEAMLEAAARAPDRGRFRPWRLLPIEGDARRSLGELLAESLARLNPLAGAEVLTREREKALRAPVIIAQGLGAFWRTGEAADDEVVKGALGIGADDLIIGFIYIGTDVGVAPSRPRPTVQDFAQRWTGDSRTRSTS